MTTCPWNSKDGGQSLRILEISDIHIGHTNTTAQDIVGKLRRQVSCDRTMAELDLIVIAGDYWDKLLKTNSPEYVVGVGWLQTLVRQCRHHRVVCRVVEGTTLHDHHQSEILSAIVSEMEKDGRPEEIDVKYVRDLSIEHIGRLGIDVLYVPDNLGDGSTLFTQVRDLMTQSRVESVDFAFMHGCFRYQMPEIADHPSTHREEDYLSVVKYQIFIGHHHTFSHRGRICAAGSFDCLTHGDEAAKGFIRYDLYPDGTYRLTHVHNEEAKRYVTLSMLSENKDACLRQIAKTLAGLPEGSVVRLQMLRDHPLQSMQAEMPRLFPSVRWTAAKVVDGEQDDAGLLGQKKSQEPDHVSLDINPKTVAKMVDEELARMGVTEVIRLRSLEMLKDLK